MIYVLALSSSPVNVSRLFQPNLRHEVGKSGNAGAAFKTPEEVRVWVYRIFRLINTTAPLDGFESYRVFLLRVSNPM